MTGSSAVRQRSKFDVEWRTLALIVAAWSAFMLLTYFWRELGWLVVAPVGAYLVCLHGSLQHEAVHGHPTRSALINEALVFVPVGVLFPYRRYKSLHLTHHNNDHLTDPLRDPESYYLEPQAWRDLPKSLKILLTINKTLLGRLVLGPAITTVLFISAELRSILNGNRDVAGVWVIHVAGMAGLYYWISTICGMPFWQYVMFIAYWGLSLTLMRSYAEHRAHPSANCRTVVIEANPVLSFMYLNNNLHMAHHDRPGMAWYDLPSYYRANRERLLRDNCGYLIRGYWQLARKFAVHPVDTVEHPLPGSLKPPKIEPT